MGAVGFGDNRRLAAVMVRGSAAGLSAGKDPGGGRRFHPQAIHGRQSHGLSPRSGALVTGSSLWMNS